MFIRRLSPVAILLALFFSVAIAADAPATEPSKQGSESVTRVYDVSDLLRQTKNYPSPSKEKREESYERGGSGGGGGGVAQMQVTADSAQTTDAFGTRQEMIDRLAKLLQDAVPGMDLHELSGRFIVSGAPDAHQKIGELLSALRENQGQMVVIHAYWLLLDPLAIPSAEKHPGELPQCDDKVITSQNLYCSAQTICFNGQTVYVTSGKNRAVVKGITPSVGSNAVGYEPHVEMVRSGVVLQVTPHLEPGGDNSRLVLDLHSSMTETEKQVDTTIPSAAPATQPADAIALIDRNNEVNQEMRTTVRLPLGKKVFVGGMTLEPSAKEPGLRQLCLIVEADAVK